MGGGKLADEALIRLINLFELLSQTSQPLTQEQITDQIPGLPPGMAAKARAFERAKASLREMGIPVEAVTLPGRSNVGYRINRSDIELELGLTSEEEAALEAAMACATFGVEIGDPGRSRLGLLYRTAAPIVWQLPELDRIPSELGGALRDRRAVSFGYRGVRRFVVPDGVLVRWGHAYLVGTDLESNEPRNFRIDRLELPVTIDSKEVVAIPPVDLSTALPRYRWQVASHEPTERIVVRMPLSDHDLVPLVESWLTSDGGAKEGVVAVAQLDLFIAELIGWRGEVRVVSPSWFAERVVSYLDDVIAHYRSSGAVIEVTGVIAAGEIVDARRNRRRLGDRFDLVAGVLGYLRRHGGVSTIGELAGVFEFAPSDMASLLESVSLCGVPPYTPDVLFEILVDRELDLVEVRLDTLLTRPRQVDIVEGISTLVTVEAVARVMNQEVPELDTAVTKLRSAIWGQFQRCALHADVEPPDSVARLRRAILSELCVEIDYRPATGSPGLRHVSPVRLMMLGDRWYLYAVHRGEARRYRLDRIVSFEVCQNDGCTSEEVVARALDALDLSDPFDSNRRGEAVEVELTGRGREILDYLTMGAAEILSPSHVRVWSLSREWTVLLLIQLGSNARASVSADVVTEVIAEAERLRRLVVQEHSGT
ncbi:MAG: helix-turn-helix transcriptional regulator [Ferrimicrobium sp.]